MNKNWCIFLDGALNGLGITMDGEILDGKSNAVTDQYVRDFFREFAEASKTGRALWVPPTNKKG